MSSQPNRLRPTTTALAMLRRGWLLESPDEQFRIYMNTGDNITVSCKADGKRYSYPLTADGFDAMMNEIVNPPF